MQLFCFSSLHWPAFWSSWPSLPLTPSQLSPLAQALFDLHPMPSFKFVHCSFFWPPNYPLALTFSPSTDRLVCSTPVGSFPKSSSNVFLPTFCDIKLYSISFSPLVYWCDEQTLSSQTTSPMRLDARFSFDGKSLCALESLSCTWQLFFSSFFINLFVGRVCQVDFPISYVIFWFSPVCVFRHVKRTMFTNVCHSWITGHECGQLWVFPTFKLTLLKSSNYFAIMSNNVFARIGFF